MQNERDADVEQRSVDELVAMVARSQTDLIERAGGLERLARADPFEIAAHLQGRDVDVPKRSARAPPSILEAAQAVAAAFELGRRLAIEQARPRRRLGSPDAVAYWARPRLATLGHEELWILALDGRAHLRAARCIAKGGLHGASVRAADPLRAALRLDASAFVLVHNHPSGDPSPSREDIHFTEQVSLAAQIAGVPLVDHVVVAREGVASVPLRDRG